MLKIIFLLLLFSFSFCNISFSQNKAFIIQNLWNNDLNNYTPTEFLTQLFTLLKDKLHVNEFIDSRIILESNSAEDWNKKVESYIRERNLPRDSAYFIAIASELKLPAFNLGKFLFKNPPRTSKFIFMYHIYDGSATEIISDTIINRGCVSNTVSEKGSKYFYTDYQSFTRDMQCHVEIIRQRLEGKIIPKKQKLLPK